jgi:uncharacterized protein (DUF433 family)
MASAIDLATGEFEGEPIIKGIRTTMRAVVKNWQSGLSPQKNIICLLRLTLAQAFEVLSYYSGHWEEINVYAEASLDISLADAVEDKKERAPPIFSAENSGLQFNQMLLAKNLL